MSRTRPNLGVICVGLLLLTSAVARAGKAPVPSEYQVKAAYIFNFARFVEWPAGSFEPGTPITLCLLGDDPFGADLEQTIGHKMVGGREFIVRRSSRLQELTGCHILFIGSSEKGRLSQILPSLGVARVLTVSETEEFVERGGMINFSLEESRVRLEINVDAAERAGLQISSKLLKVARVVRSAK